MPDGVAHILVRARVSYLLAGAGVAVAGSLYASQAGLVVEGVGVGVVGCGAEAVGAQDPEGHEEAQ